MKIRVGKTPAEIYWGRDVVKKGSMINELKDKQKYTLTHNKNYP